MSSGWGWGWGWGTKDPETRARDAERSTRRAIKGVERKRAKLQVRRDGAKERLEHLARGASEPTKAIRTAAKQVLRLEAAVDVCDNSVSDLESIDVDLMRSQVQVAKFQVLKETVASMGHLSQTLPGPNAMAMAMRYEREIDKMDMRQTQMDDMLTRDSDDADGDSNLDPVDQLAQLAIARAQADASHLVLPGPPVHTPGSSANRMTAGATSLSDVRGELLAPIPVPTATATATTSAKPRSRLQSVTKPTSDAKTQQDRKRGQ